eukprot:1449740-Rhodomonas_salina.1
MEVFYQGPTVPAEAGNAEVARPMCLRRRDAVPGTDIALTGHKARVLQGPGTLAYYQCVCCCTGRAVAVVVRFRAVQCRVTTCRAVACHARAAVEAAARGRDDAATYGDNAAIHSDSTAVYDDDTATYGDIAAVYGDNTAVYGDNAAVYSDNAGIHGDMLRFMARRVPIFAGFGAINGGNAGIWRGDADVSGGGDEQVMQDRALQPAERQRRIREIMAERDSGGATGDTWDLEVCVRCEQEFGVCAT